MSILSKRFQQGVFEAAASSNRAAGSGGGSGLSPLVWLGKGLDNAADTITATTFTVVPGVSVAFNLSRTLWVAFSAFSISKTSGGGGTFAYMNVYIDGVVSDAVGLWDKGNTGYTSCGDFSTVSTVPLAPGTHTVDLRVKVDSGQTWLNYTTSLNLFLLGG
jgi:hypothetical protein